MKSSLFGSSFLGALAFAAAAFAGQSATAERLSNLRRMDLAPTADNLRSSTNGGRRIGRGNAATKRAAVKARNVRRHRAANR